MATTGLEIVKHRHEFEALIRKVMLEHTQRKGCGWKRDAVENILCDITVSIERQEVCKDRVAA